jgi:GNAT superfamily N-acetyltransferase
MDALEDPVRAPAAILEAPEIAGYRDMWSAPPADLATRMGIAHAEVGAAHCTAVAALPGVRVLNHALGLPGDRSLSEDELEAVERFYEEGGVSALVALRAGAEAESQLVARGYARDYAWVKFARDVAPPPTVSCELAVRPVAPPEAERMAEILAASFELPSELVGWFAAVPGRPGWHCLGAYDGEHLVATGSLYVHERAGWLTWAATDPAHRGRRAQRALLAARIEIARARGLGLLVMETGEQVPGRPDASYRNILWAGFRPAYVRPFWRGSSRA